MTFLYTLIGATRKQKEKTKVFSLMCIQKSNVIKKNNLGFSIWIYVFGFSQCNGLIKSYIETPKIPYLPPLNWKDEPITTCDKCIWSGCEWCSDTQEGNF